MLEKLKNACHPKAFMCCYGKIYGLHCVWVILFNFDCLFFVVTASHLSLCNNFGFYFTKKWVTWFAYDLSVRYRTSMGKIIYILNFRSIKRFSFLDTQSINIWQDNNSIHAYLLRWQLRYILNWYLFQLINHQLYIVINMTFVEFYH